MNMKTRKLKIVCLTAVTLLGVLISSCKASDSPKLPSGTLVWIQNDNTIDQWNNTTGQKKPLLTLPYGTTIESLTKVTSTELIFSSYRTQGAPESTDYHLWLFNIKSKKLTKLRTGSMPTYVKNAHKLFFLDEGQDLFMADYRVPGAITNVEKIHAEGQITVGDITVIQVSPNEVIFNYYAFNGIHQILEYNIKTGKWKPLPIASCNPVLWRKPAQQILCTKGDSFNYYLTNLQGDYTVSMGNLSYTNFFLYLPRIDAAFASRPSSSIETNDIWIYYFETEEWNRLVKNANGSLGTATWFGDKAQ
ncbi:MAG: hypothetical protein ACRER1_03720 [Gammaproteobacteria bacterium]